jgi:hypothetical protein
MKAVIDASDDIYTIRIYGRGGSLSLYGGKPVIALADTSPLVMHEDERLDVAIDRALERSQQDIYDDIIVVNELTW